MNIAHQNTIDDSGKIVGKDRLTNNMSMRYQSGISVNDRVRQDDLLPCRFGACTKRLVNWAVAARRKYPNVKIKCCKTDWSAAYRRQHMAAKECLLSSTHLPDEDLLLISLRLPFGGSACAPEWNAISEMVTDLANAILHEPDWNPLELHSPEVELITKAKELPDDIPFGVGRNLVVDVPVNDKGLEDVYIDDIISVGLDLPGSDNMLRIERAALLAIHVIGRELHPEEPILRTALVALAKFLAEARSEEIKINLGWKYDFRRLIVSLPRNKFLAWCNATEKMLSDGKVDADELERNIGRYVNVGMVLPYIHHFLGRLRGLLRRAKRQRHPIPIDTPCQKDLELMRDILYMAMDGVDMNLIAYLWPNRVYRSDACPRGLGGYSDEGFAWRWYLPPELQNRASSNLLEHVATVVSPWVDILAGRLKKGDCSLSMSDNTTSMGWLKGSNFNDFTYPDDPIQAEIRAEVCRHHAMLFMTNSIKEYSQWFPGEENNVSDALSRDDDRDDDELTQILTTFCAPQVPEGFKIVPLPSEIVSWMISLLQRLPVREQSLEKHTRTSIGRGDDGWNTQKKSVSPTTCSSTISPDRRGSNSWVPLPWLCATDAFCQRLMEPWLKEQSEVPFQMWHRPSGRTTGPTPPSITMESLDNFYQVSSARSETQTRLLNNKNASRQSC